MPTMYRCNLTNRPVTCEDYCLFGPTDPRGLGHQHFLLPGSPCNRCSVYFGMRCSDCFGPTDIVTLPDITIQPVTEAERIRTRVTALLDEEQARIDAFRLSQGRGFQRPYRFFDQIRAALCG